MKRKKVKDDDEQFQEESKFTEEEYAFLDEMRELTEEFNQ